MTGWEVDGKMAIRDVVDRVLHTLALQVSSSSLVDHPDYDQHGPSLAPPTNQRINLLVTDIVFKRYTFLPNLQ